MGALLFVVDRLADIVQQARTLGKIDVQPQLRRHHTGELCDLDGMLVHILAVAGAVFEPAEQFDQLGMQAEDTDFEHGGFAVLLDLLIQFLAHLFHRLFDAGGMDAAVADQLFERKAGDFAADRIKSGEDDHFGRIVDDQFDTRRIFESADVAALATDDARLHIVVGQRHDGDGDLGRMIGSAALDREADDLFRVHVRLVLRLLFDVAYLQGNVVTGLVEDIFGEDLFGFLAGELGDLFQLLDHQIVLVVHLFLHLFDLVFLSDEIFLLLLQRIRALLQGIFLFVEIVFLLHQALFCALQFRSLFFGFTFKFVSEF